MSITDVYHQFITGIQQTGVLEFVGVFAGIICVWFSRKEDILVYPIGLVNTIIYIYLSIKGHLLGEASVNLYYTVMSIYGWILWAKKDKQKNEAALHITNSSRKEWIQHLLFFAAFYITIFVSLTSLGRCICECYGIYRYVAYGQKKNRKLDLVDRNKFCVDSVILY
jgi:nicotinamide mononucleotide transporter